MESIDSRFFVVIVTVILLMLVMMLALVYSKFLRKKAEFIIQQKIEQARYQQELSKSQIEIKEQTLTYVGQELHDDLGQKLSVAKLLNNMLAGKVQEELRDDLQEINMIIGECIQDIRNLSRTFISGQVEFYGLIESIELEVARIKKLRIPAIEFENLGEECEIPKDHALILFRIVQECLNNALKHSKARNLLIKIQSNSRTILIKVEDDGIGISEEHNHGSGLDNMANRASVVGAKFTVKSVPHQGTSISIAYQNRK